MTRVAKVRTDRATIIGETTVMGADLGTESGSTVVMVPSEDIDEFNVEPKAKPKRKRKAAVQKPPPGVDERLRHEKVPEFLVPKLELFVKAMRDELGANAWKCTDEGYGDLSAKEAAADCAYHMAKFVRAVVDGEPKSRVLEHAADVANLALIMADIAGALTDEVLIDRRLEEDDMEHKPVAERAADY